MRPQDKMALQAQVQALNSVVNMAWTQASTGAGLPIVTATGPAAAPGLNQLAVAMNQQKDAMLQLLNIVKKIIDES